MRQTALAFLLSLSLAAHAQTVGTVEPTADVVHDPIAELVSSKGLTGRLDNMRQHMSLAASDLVVTAMGFLGVPYRRGGNTVETGFDCSGFVRAMYEQTVGLVLPRRASEQAEATQTIAREELKPGDLVFFNTMRRAFSHVGIYVGDGKFIHSPRSGSQIRVEDMRSAYWNTRFNGARRVALEPTPNLQALPPR